MVAERKKRGEGELRVSAPKKEGIPGMVGITSMSALWFLGKNKSGLLGHTGLRSSPTISAYQLCDPDKLT